MGVQVCWEIEVDWDIHFVSFDYSSTTKRGVQAKEP